MKMFSVNTEMTHIKNHSVFTSEKCHSYYNNCNIDKANLFVFILQD